MPTERLYYEDSYLAEFRSEVVASRNDGLKVFLSRSAFYPTSGGQPHDLGVLGGVEIVDVVEEEEGIAHVLRAPMRQPIVDGQIDWPRRYDHMQQHTGQHLLSAVFVDFLGLPTVSFHMGADVSTIELGTKELSEDEIAEAEQRSNAMAREERRVRIVFEDATEAKGLRKASERSGMLRIVQIDGLDRSACGGTHVRSTAECLPIQIRRTERIRGNVRLEFLCGDRARRRSKLDFHLLMALARTTSSSLDELPTHISALQTRLAEAEKERLQLQTEISRREAQALYSATEPSDDGVRRAFLARVALDESARVFAQAFIESGKSVLLLKARDSGTVLAACSAGSGFHAGKIMKEVLSSTGGRGGGSATLAQGHAPENEAAMLLATKLGFHPEATR